MEAVRVTYRALVLGMSRYMTLEINVTIVADNHTEAGNQFDEMIRNYFPGQKVDVLEIYSNQLEVE